MRDALSLADQAIAYGGGRLEEGAVRAMLGSVDRGHARRLVEALARRDGRDLLESADGLRQLGLSAAGTLEEMATLLQQMAVVQAVPDALDAQDPESADAIELSTALSAAETQLLYSMVLHGRPELALMNDEYAALTMVLLRFLAFPSEGRSVPTPPPARTPAAPRAPVAVPSPKAAATPPMAPASAPAPPPAPRQAADDIPPWVDAPDEMDVAAPEPKAEPRSAAPLRAPAPASITVPAPELPSAASGPTLVQSELGDRWCELVGRVADQGALVALTRELAWQAGPVAVDDVDGSTAWRLFVERDSLRSPSLRDKLAALLSAYAEAPVKLELEAGTPIDSMARRETHERARRQREAEQVIRDDPAVVELMRQFKTARIVAGSIKPV
jgi:DNA polymerase-3 subunit gamma/tau